LRVRRIAPGTAGYTSPVGGVFAVAQAENRTGQNSAAANNALALTRFKRYYMEERSFVTLTAWSRDH